MCCGELYASKLFGAQNQLNQEEGEAMERNKGLGVESLRWLCHGLALTVLLAVPARGEQKAAPAPGDTDLRQRVERLEAQEREKPKADGGGMKVGGHFGFVIPLATSNGKNVANNFVVGFPVGVTVKKDGPWAFDMELVPTIHNHDVDLTVHPGVLYAIDENWTAGLRMGFDINNHAWGPTPLINRKICDLNDSMHLFVELPVPIRIGEHSTNVTAALHMGVGF